MKVLLVTNDFPPHIGGVDEYVAQIARRFPPGDITIFTSSANGAEVFDATFPQPVIRWPARVLLPLPSVRHAVLEHASRLRPDIVLFGAAMPLALLGAAVQKELGIPYGTFTHGLEIAAARLPGGRTMLARIFRDARFVTTVSRWTADLLRPMVGTRTSIALLPAGVDVSRFRPDVRSDDVLARHRIETGPVISCVSRLVARKGQDMVIRALPRIASEFGGVRFLVVGRGPDEARLRTLARREGVAERVVFTGAVSYMDLPAYFRAGHVFAMPCRHRRFGLDVEALGAVYLQAAGVGRPSLGGRVGGVADAIQHGATGVLVDPDRLAEIEEALLALLRDPARAERMGARAAARVHSEFSWELIVARLRRLLDDAVETARASISDSVSPATTFS